MVDPNMPDRNNPNTNNPALADSATATSRESAISSPRSSLESRSPPSRNPSFRLSSISSAQPRQSFSDSLRGVPPSPRARRQPSLSQAAVQSLIDNPPIPTSADPAFAGRDWTQISIGELISPNDFHFVEADTGIEEATSVCRRRREKKKETSLQTSFIT